MERVEQAQKAVGTFAEREGLTVAAHVAKKLGVNSSHLSMLYVGKLTPKLDRVLVRAGMLPELPKVVEVQACSCGEVHTLKGCPKKRQSFKRNRLSISRDNVDSAARSILDTCPREYVLELIGLLEESVR